MNEKQIQIILIFLLVLLIFCFFAYQLGRNHGRIKRIEEQLNNTQEGNNYLSYNKNNIEDREYKRREKRLISLAPKNN